MEAHPDVRDVQRQPSTGSVTFTHAPGKEAIRPFAGVREAELLAEVAFEIPSSAKAAKIPTASSTSSWPT